MLFALSVLVWLAESLIGPGKGTGRPKWRDERTPLAPGRSGKRGFTGSRSAWTSLSSHRATTAGTWVTAIALWFLSRTRRGNGWWCSIEPPLPGAPLTKTTG